MNKTIYLRDGEGPIWERSRELAGDKLSPFIVSALKRFIATKEAEMAGFERIEVGFSDSEENHLPKRKAFYGKWLIKPSDPLVVAAEESGEMDGYIAVAVTAKGNAVFYTWYSKFVSERTGERFAVFPSLEAAAAESRLNEAARKAIEVLGVPVEELDI